MPERDQLRPEPIYHIGYAADWERARVAGQYTMSTRGRTLDEQGYVHASTAGQTAATANRFYAGETGLVVLVIDTRALRAPVRFEPPAPGATELFPHIYGPIEVAAVVEVVPLNAGPDGRFRFEPAGARGENGAPVPGDAT